jgi:hypothetical protein
LKASSVVASSLVLSLLLLARHLLLISLHVVLSGDAQDLTCGIILASQVGESLARAEEDEPVDGRRVEVGEAFRPADREADLSDEVLDEGGGGGDLSRDELVSDGREGKEHRQLTKEPSRQEMTGTTGSLISRASRATRIPSAAGFMKEQWKGALENRQRLVKLIFGAGGQEAVNARTHETGRSAALEAIPCSLNSSLALMIPSLLPARTT